MTLSVVWLSLFMSVVVALDNGIARTPGMGYNTWNDVYCNPTSEHIRAVADAMSEKGFLSAGYKYIVVDDCWQVSRSPGTGEILPNATAFPGGIHPLSRYVHSMGFKFGICSDRGVKTCDRWYRNKGCPVSSKTS